MLGDIKPSLNSQFPPLLSLNRNGNREIILTTFGKRIILCKAERCEVMVGT
ncbi:hypothetical protein HanXRQr2_Chr07g0279771 [Helianthus annuus]|uniref:Uncharacterized protein n=1 Tax=Helianthus annuus TaxID=4232 RepID=A0A251U9P0_HELAN|nr:hypothetical protein HanXRQr2_Chr07g0279771 [Helianthus annuus]KAJ0891112.1 hypothetical protein HanPSC8_Chr09g0349791 [Helianthus annuus]